MAQLSDAGGGPRNGTAVGDQAFRQLVQEVLDYAIYMIDTAGRVVSWNPGAERITGYRAEEAIGQHFRRFFTEEDAARGRPGQLMRRAADEGRAHDEGWR
ncbi:MAG TPA: PAS domain S-box protein, partial [Acidimicrobiales bacterium]|nr:PAS domain S-box protein [Acidimicrobiales bacterium]